MKTLPAQEEPCVKHKNKPAMLTIKECVNNFSGITESSLRKWVKQGKIPHVRAGESGRGTILIDENCLSDFLRGNTYNNV